MGFLGFLGFVWELLCQFASLVCLASWTAATLLPHVAIDVLANALGVFSKERAEDSDEASVVFYEGTVEHVRSRPVKNAFVYPVRVCTVNLDNPPAWWRAEKNDGKYSLSADQVRAKCETDGPVWLLTIPSCCGYSQSPISVYYAFARDRSCGGAEGENERVLKKCVAEVTNTPWGER